MSLIVWNAYEKWNRLYVYKMNVKEFNVSKMYKVYEEVSRPFCMCWDACKMLFPNDECCYKWIIEGRYPKWHGTCINLMHG